MFSMFPMILIVVGLYNVVILGGGLAGQDAVAMLGQSFAIPMFSGDHWKISVGDLFLLGALAMLFVETIKATRTNRREITNHALSMLTFVGALVEFIVLKGFGNSVFFFITAMCLFDVVAGYTISIVTAKRDLAVGGHDNDY